MQVGTQHAGNLGWLLDDFCRSVPGVAHALVVSGDGLRMASSRGVEDRFAEQLSAAVSGLASLARGGSALLRFGTVNQVIVEMSGGHLFASPVSQTSTLAVVAHRQCDLGMVGYEMTLLADQVGHALTPAVRSSPGDGPHPGDRP